MTAACGAPVTIDVQRQDAMQQLADPATRDLGLSTLARLALTHEGDHKRAHVYLEKLQRRPAGESAVVAGLVASARGDLPTEIDAWTAALESPDRSVYTLAVVRLLDLADYVPRGDAIERMLPALDGAPGRLRLTAAELSRALRRAARPPMDVQLAQVPEPFPLSAFVDGRFAPEDAPMRPAAVIDGELNLRNRAGALAKVMLSLPPHRGTWMRFLSTDALRVVVGAEVAIVRDVTAGAAPGMLEVFVPPSTEAVRVRADVATSRGSARLGVELVSGPKPAAHTPAKRWVDLLARAELAAHRGDRSGVQSAVQALSKAAPRLDAARIVEARAAGGGRVQKLLSAMDHARAVRILAGAAQLDGRDEEAHALLPRLAASRDPRSALLRFKILRDRGWEEQATAALREALTLAPGACEPARERLQHRWEQLKLRRANVARDLLPNGCGQLPDMAPVVAHYAAESGRPADAERMLTALASARREPTLHGPLRVRLLERLGRQDRSLELARLLAERDRLDVEPHFRLGDISASQGRRRKARAAWGRAARTGSGDMEGRRRLMAVGAGRVWERFRPPVERLLRSGPPPAFLTGQPAVLLVDHQTTLRFRDGAAINHVHQVMQLRTPGAIEELGEAELPSDAVILRAVTRKVDGRRLEPEDIAEKETLSFPQLEVGDAIELEYLTGVGTDPGLAGGWIDQPFFFQIFEVPTWRSSYVVLLQDGVIGRFDSRGAGEPEPVKASGFHGWRWTGRARPAAQAEPMAVSPFDALPQVQVWSGLDWGVLTAQAREQLLSLLAPDGRMRALVKALMPPDQAPLAGVRAIYAWVRDKITEDEGSVLSVSAAHAVATGRGERVITLLGLLRTAGYDAELAMVDPVHRQHSARKTPDVRDFSYLVVRVPRPDGQGHIWLDTTFQHAPFGFISPTIRDRPARIVGPNGVGASVTTPNTTSTDERRTVRIDLNVAADGSLSGAWSELARGMDGVMYRDALARLNVQDRKRALAQLVQEVLPGARVSAMEIADLEAVDRPVRLQYAIERAASGRTGPQALRLGLLPLNLSRRWIRVAQRRTAMYADRYEDLDLTVVVRLAPGAELTSSLPKDVRRKGPFGMYERTVSRDGRAITIHKLFRISPQVVPPAGYGLFRRFCAAVDEADRLELSVTRGS